MSSLGPSKLSHHISSVLEAVEVSNSITLDFKLLITGPHYTNGDRMHLKVGEEGFHFMIHQHRIKERSGFVIHFVQIVLLPINKDQIAGYCLAQVDTAPITPSHC